MEQPPPYSPDAQTPPQGYAPPPNTGYPPQSAPHPTQFQQPGYPPQKEYGGGYPPQGQGYPPQNQGYPPQSQGYPPQNQGYPPQNQGYPPQNQGYPPQNQGYPPQGQGYVQQPAGFSSQTNNTTTVVVQNQPRVVTGVIPVVNDQMGLSIVACLFCCCPIGIFAIMKSSEARNLYVAGDYTGAMAAAQSARNLAYAAIVCGLILIPLGIILRVVVFTTETSSNYN